MLYGGLVAIMLRKELFGKEKQVMMISVREERTKIVAEGIEPRKVLKGGTKPCTSV